MPNDRTAIELEVEVVRKRRGGLAGGRDRAGNLVVVCAAHGARAGGRGSDGVVRTRTGDADTRTRGGVGASSSGGLRRRRGSRRLGLRMADRACRQRLLCGAAQQHGLRRRRRVGRPVRRHGQRLAVVPVEPQAALATLRRPNCCLVAADGHVAGPRRHGMGDADRRARLSRRRPRSAIESRSPPPTPPNWRELLWTRLRGGSPCCSTRRLRAPGSWSSKAQARWSSCRYGPTCTARKAPKPPGESNRSGGIGSPLALLKATRPRPPSTLN